MSMHKIKLTDLEHSGLLENHLPIGEPSQLSDCFRLGIQYATKDFNETVVQLCKEKNALQAKIDSLMLEYCPEEMTKEQLHTYTVHQNTSFTEIE